MAINGFIRKTYWTLAAAGLIYALALGALTYPTIQRNATYAHNVNPAYWQNLTNVEQYGFLHHQIQPFTVTTPDNVTIFAWHILPAHLYLQHEQALKSQVDFGQKPYAEAAKTVGLRLLLDDPNATLVVSFHGNAAHLASAHRPASYQQFLGASTPDKPVHVIAFDYRGFGWSTGSPTEEGVIQDSVSLLSAIAGTSHDTNTGPSAVDPSRIILVGQSMGTFVSTALYHEWVLHLGRAPFKALMLVAGFSSLTNLLESYSIKGIIPPILSPLIAYPRVRDYMVTKIVDKWDTSSRLVALVGNPEVKLDLIMLHARDDWEIPWIEGRASWDRAIDAASQGKIDWARNLNFEEWQSGDGSKKMRWERVSHGGHNRIPTSEHAKLAILRTINA